MRLDVAAADDDVGPVARYTIHSYEDERGPGLENVGVGGHLRNMERDRAVFVDGIGVVQLEGALAHVHSVSGPTWAHDHDLRIRGSGVRGTRIGRGRYGDIKVFTTVGEGAGDASRDRTVCCIVGRIEIFNLVGSWEGRGKVDIDIGVGASDHDGTIRKKEGGGVVQPRNVRGRQTIRTPPGAFGGVRVVDTWATDGSRGQ